MDDIGNTRYDKKRNSKQCRGMEKSAKHLTEIKNKCKKSKKK